MLENVQTSETTQLSPEPGERLVEPPFILQTTYPFRDDFVAAVSKATEHVGIETMQLEACKATEPIFGAIKDAKRRGVEVDFLYEPSVALRHIRAERDPNAPPRERDAEAYVFLGRTMLHKGDDKPAIKLAHQKRTSLVAELDSQAITKQHPKRPVLIHDHVKLALADNVGWFGSMNLRELDFEASNFMMKVTDPTMLSALKEIFALSMQPNQTEDREYVLRGVDDRPETRLLLDAGVRRQSIIYQTALDMASSLEEGDKFVMISQWPPAQPAFGKILKILDSKLAQGVQGSFMVSPAEYLHPSRRVSFWLQRKFEEKYGIQPNVEAINLSRRTHAKAFMVNRANGEREVLFGSHNFTGWTVAKGNRELSMWSKDSMIVDQIASFLDDVQSE